MHIDDSSYTQNGKTYKRVLLRTSYREGNKVKKKTIANLTHCDPNEVALIKLALQHKDDIEGFAKLEGKFSIENGISVGAIGAVLKVAKELGIDKALGNSKEGKLALWQVIARVLEQGSRLSAVRLANMHASLELLGLDDFNEDDLYYNLEWLCENQKKIEKRLLKKLTDRTLFLYDVTSSYFEGQKNELAEYGYNRDKKKGKKQVVIGLLTDSTGQPVSIEAFKGNTSDTETVSNQVKKLKSQFKVSQITLVGDRGMIKSPQMKLLRDNECNYITAISRAQIQTLINKEVIQLSLFDDDLIEVSFEGNRYILRRNPIRAEQIAINREEKTAKLKSFCIKQTRYLQEHKKASPEKALTRITSKIEKLKMTWITAEYIDGEFVITEDKERLRELVSLDGCYCLKTDLPELVSKETIHSRYKDLKYVEADFRRSKSILDLRPILVRKEARTRGLLVVVMLACKIIRKLEEYWKGINCTVTEGLKSLFLISSQTVTCNELTWSKVSSPNDFQKQLLDAAGISLPSVIPTRAANVDTRKDLSKKRNP